MEYFSGAAPYLTDRLRAKLISLNTFEDLPRFPRGVFNVPRWI